MDTYASLSAHFLWKLLVMNEHHPKQYFYLNNQNALHHLLCHFVKMRLLNVKLFLIIFLCGALRLGYIRLKASWVEIVEEKFCKYNLTIPEHS